MKHIPIATIMIASSVLTSRGETQTLQAGFAERDITPEIGMEVPGGYGKVFHAKVHDPCKVRAVVFGDGNARVALVGLDALMVPRHLVDSARREIALKCTLDPRAVLIGASHSHSSGPTGMVQPGEFDGASDLVRSLAYDKSSCANAGYLERVRKAVVDAVCDADRVKSKPASASARGPRTRWRSTVASR